VSDLARGPGARGRPFAAGNPGRKPGSRNKTSLISAALLEGEQGELLCKAIELAKRGNVPLLKFLLARLLPRDRFVTLDLPQIASASDALNALRSILRAVAAGTITPAEGGALAALLAPFIGNNPGKPSASGAAPSLMAHLQSNDQD
jgi:hypothetical protein